MTPNLEFREFFWLAAAVVWIAAVFVIVECLK